MKSYFITSCYTFRSSILTRLWLQLTPQLKSDFKLTHIGKVNLDSILQMVFREELMEKWRIKVFVIMVEDEFSCFIRLRERESSNSWKVRVLGLSCFPSQPKDIVNVNGDFEEEDITWKNWSILNNRVKRWISLGSVSIIVSAKKD